MKGPRYFSILLGLALFAGLAAASAAGLLIGYSAPDALPFLGAGTTATADATYDLIDLAPGYGVQAAFEG